MKIVCLCGSTKFKTEFEDANLEETLAGNIVLSVGCFSHADKIPITEEQKEMLDAMHIKKIDMADEVRHVAPHYTGESTKRELDYARSKGKVIR